MRGRIAFRLFGVLAIGGLALLWSFGCDDKPTEPGPGGTKDYWAYFYNLQHDTGNWYFAYRPATNELDSFFLPCRHRPVVSADGDKIFVRDPAEDATAIVDLQSYTVVGHLPYRMPLAVSPDNRFIAVDSNALLIVRLADTSVLFRDAALLWGGVFSASSQRLYGWSADGWLRVFDLTSAPPHSEAKSFRHGLVRGVVPSPDELQWYLYLATTTQARYLFAVYDVATDSIVFSDSLFPGGGEIEVSLDGHYVYYTNPSSMLYGGGDAWVHVYDAATNREGDSISTQGVLEPPFELGVPVAEICITPDGRWLVATHYDGWPYIVAADLRQMAIVKHRILGWPSSVQGLDCQNGL